MATFLDLPREIYLIICSLLSTKELVKLASLSRQHYLAVQRPLYSLIRLNSSRSLVKLVGALTRPPVVPLQNTSRHASSCRSDDFQSDARQVERLCLTLNLGAGLTNVEGATAAVLSQCIQSIKCNCDRVRIDLTLEEVPSKFVDDMRFALFPGVTEIKVFLHRSEQRWGEMYAPRYQRVYLEWVQAEAWTRFLSRDSFPDLRKVYIASMVASVSKLPSNMTASLTMETRCRSPIDRHGLHTAYRDFLVPFALTNIEEISIEHNDMLYGRTLGMLLASNIVTEHLTKLRIVNCPSLHPIVEMETIATLLRRSLPVLRFLTLHLTPHDDGNVGYKIAYRSKISENPAHHICNIVRELGQVIEGLDLLLPFACHHMFAQSAITRSSHAEPIDLKVPSILAEPASTLPDRLIAAGYRYRRIVFNDFCCDEDDWGEMMSRASDQGDNISWELLYDLTLSEKSKGVWLMSDCLPVELSVQNVMQRPFRD